MKATFLNVFFFAADAVSLNFLTHNITVLWLANIPMDIEVPTKYTLSHSDRIGLRNTGFFDIIFLDLTSCHTKYT